MLKYLLEDPNIDFKVENKIVFQLCKNDNLVFFCNNFT